MKRVLVFPCGSEIGLEIASSLKCARQFELWGASTILDHGRFAYKNYLQMSSVVSDDKFIAELIKIVQEYNINYIFPAHDSVVLKLSENRDLIPCSVLTSPVKTCSICRSKRSTYLYFTGIVPVPDIFDVDGIVSYPVFLKPDVGQGSKGTFLANSRDEVLFYLKKDPSLLILEYLPGKEYTVDCFTDNAGCLLFSEGRERARISNGISVNTRPSSNPDFTILADKINEVLKFSGAWFFQVKENTQKELVLMEIAPRIAGSMGLQRNRGVNLPLMTLYDTLGFEVKVQKNDYTIEMDRALGNSYALSINYDSVYVDFDDSLIIDGKINTQIIHFLYQCLNKNIKILLLTRHDGDIREKLRKFRMDFLFDEIIHIGSDEQKSKYVHGNAIFIDDSFRERADVSRICKIPVFDPSAVESLIDGRML